uniref:Uncharacterized protein n=1 Tax=Anguilla anguilla TaxID=7936 RepID=A0A0E9TCX2_ANGAN
MLRWNSETVLCH